MMDVYSFKGKELSYSAFRPNWDMAFAVTTLRKAGIEKRADDTWIGTVHGAPPVVVSVGAGTGADSALFKQLGCHVILVDPSKSMLDIARSNLARIKNGTAEFHVGSGMKTGLPEKIADVIVLAQAAHTLKESNVGQRQVAVQQGLMTEEQAASRTGTEELSRQHLVGLLKKNDQARFSIWYYNLVETSPTAVALDNTLRRNLPEYAASKTPLVNAPHFEPNHFQPWLNVKRMDISGVMPVQQVALSAGDVSPWLHSYSFSPKDTQKRQAVVRALQEDWLRKFEHDGRVILPYFGYMAQGPIRSNAFLMQSINKPVAVHSPFVDCAEQPVLPSAKSPCPPVVTKAFE